MEENERERQIEELKGMLDLFLGFLFTAKQRQLFQLRTIDLLSWKTISSITGMREVACRTMFHRMQDRVKVARQISERYKKLTKGLDDLRRWEGLTSDEQKLLKAWYRGEKK